MLSNSRHVPHENVIPDLDPGLIALERHGWEVIHGIVDSLWVRRMHEDATPIEEVATAITEEIQLKLEFEAEYVWVCFVPKRDSNAGAHQVLREGGRSG